jgi:hypothetical protein
MKVIEGGVVCKQFFSSSAGVIIVKEDSCEKRWQSYGFQVAKPYREVKQ